MRKFVHYIPCLQIVRMTGIPRYMYHASTCRAFVRNRCLLPLVTLLALSAPVADGFCGGVPKNAEEFDSILHHYDDLVSASLQSTGIPGVAITVVYGNKVEYLRTEGLRNTSTKEPID